MKISLSHLSLATILCVSAGVGCSKQETASTPSPPVTTEQGASDEHANAAVKMDHSQAGHGHGAGPHDGTIADWGGGEYHVEFTVEHDKQEATVHVLGSDEKTPAPIDAEEIQISITEPMMQISLKPAPQENDPAGTASRFIGNHEKLAVVQEYAGTISGVVDETPYTGDFKEEAHAAHDE